MKVFRSKVKNYFFCCAGTVMAGRTGQVGRVGLVMTQPKIKPTKVVFVVYTWVLASLVTSDKP